MEQVFVIGDVHGELDLFKEMLEFFDPKMQQLILIGDLNDRGSKSKDCWLLGKRLVEESQAIYLRGNHEEYFLQFLKKPEDWFESYKYNGGKETIESLLHPGACEEYSPTEIAMFILGRYKELVEFLIERPFYYEWNQYVFVHAGIDLRKADWRKTNLHDFLWIREPFHTEKNTTGKVIVFGHTITPMLHGDMQTTTLWQSDNKIGIDGGAVFGGSLHGVIFDTQGIVEDHELPNMKGPWQPTV
ncbi:metallophosphoesterase [Enterococcus sp. AZ109]|uniref:metallophosphoesterase n=1 Tax=Enterococcus sp. AZ109 TaxID=2774634 RepID=UPI003F262233